MEGNRSVDFELSNCDVEFVVTLQHFTVSIENLTGNSQLTDKQTSKQTD